MKRKLFCLIFAALLCLSLTITVCAASAANIYDEADLLSSSEEARLSEKLSEVGRQFDVQIVIMSLSSTNGSIDVLVEELYDGMNMGFGETHDGILLLVCMDIREYRILSNGMANNAIGSYEIDEICDAIESCLSDGDYAAAFDTFVDECDYYLDGYFNGYPFNFGKTLLICLAIGIAAGLIVVFILKAQLTSVRRQNRANVYEKPGSMQITFRNDLFLYRNVVRTKKETSSSSRSGSGSSRSVGGGRF